MATSYKPTIGEGIFSLRDVADILQLPYYKVHRWINRYWDGQLGAEHGVTYSWRVDDVQAVNFHTLVELYLALMIRGAGVRPRKIIEAHHQLSLIYNSEFPFAQRQILDGIRTDGKSIFFELPSGEVITLDGTNQLNLQFVKAFFHKLEFGEDDLATKFYPLGKERSIVVDPARKFGHPVLTNRNIYPETLYSLHLAGEPVDFIAHLYELSSTQVNDALEYCKRAA